MQALQGVNPRQVNCNRGALTPAVGPLAGGNYYHIVRLRRVPLEVLGHSPSDQGPRAREKRPEGRKTLTRRAQKAARPSLSAQKAARLSIMSLNLGPQTRNQRASRLETRSSGLGQPTRRKRRTLIRWK